MGGLRSRAVLLTLAGFASACGSESATPPPSGSAGSSSRPSSGGAPAVAVGSAGTSAGSSSSGSTSASGAAGSLGASGSPNSGASSSGGASGGGTAGLGGATAGAAQGGGAGAADALAAAAVLNHYQLLDPCQSSYHAVLTPGDVCPQDTTVKNQKIQLQFAGDPGVTYDVTLHVRGIMEGYWYTGGVLDEASKQFYTGGVPTIGGFSSACKNKTSELPFTLPPEITPTDDCWNGFNMFALTVSAPAQHYYLNSTSEKNGDRPPHAVYASDYTVKIPIQGQAKLEFYIIGSDEHECYNFNAQLSGVTTVPSPYIGEFAQFDVTSVTPAP